MYAVNSYHKSAITKSTTKSTENPGFRSVLTDISSKMHRNRHIPFWSWTGSLVPIISFLSNITSNIIETAVRLWNMWHTWVQKDGTLFTPRQSSSHQMSELLHFLSREAEITAVEAGKLGSQLKLSFLLAGGQVAVFRPMWYSRGHVIEEAGNKGADRHNGEIAAFHLARILG